MQAPADRPDRRALRAFGDFIDKRITKLIQRYSVLVHALPGTSDFPLPPANPPIPLGASRDEYLRRVVMGFISRGAVIKRDISAYFYYQHQVDGKAIFEFAALNTRSALQEAWVQMQLTSWQHSRKQAALGRFFGFYRGKRPPQSQAEKQVIAGVVRILVDQHRQEQGCSIQAALYALANRPFQATLDEDEGPKRFTFSKSSLEDMYYRRGIYLLYDLRWWQLFYKMYEVAEAFMRYYGQPSLLPKASTRYHRKFGLPLIPESVVSPSFLSVPSRHA